MSRSFFFMFDLMEIFNDFIDDQTFSWFEYSHPFYGSVALLAMTLFLG